MPKIKNRIGIRYGHLVVITFIDINWVGNQLKSFWKCHCDCGNETIVQGSNLQSKNTKSCGCLQVGKNSANYIHGKCCGKNTKAIQKLKEQIRKRDNYICQNCKITQKECKKKFNRKLDVHHKDGDNTNNIEENMITLCYSCHRKMHLNKNKNG